MTRCEYIPPDGRSVIALAKGRSGATDSDIAALVDRFGCKAEARFEMTAEEDSDREQFSCIDHVGHLCGDTYWIVQPIYRSSEVPFTIASAHGIARAGFGVPIPETHELRSPGLILRSGDNVLTLHPTSVTPDWDGISATQKIVTPISIDEMAILNGWLKAHARLSLGKADESWYITELSFASGSHDPLTMVTLTLKQIHLIRQPTA